MSVEPKQGFSFVKRCELERDRVGNESQILVTKAVATQQDGNCAYDLTLSSAEVCDSLLVKSNIQA